MNKKNLTPNMDTELRRYGIRSFLKRSTLLTFLAVMIYGFFQFNVRFLIWTNITYNPAYMLQMIGPVAITLWIIHGRFLNKLRYSHNGGAIPRRVTFWEATLFSVVCFISASLLSWLSWLSPTDVFRAAILPTLAVALPTASLLGWLFVVTTNVTRERLHNGRGRRLTVFQAMRRSRVIESTIIVIGSVMTFGLVEFIFNGIIRNDWQYKAFDMVGMILPMAVIMGGISYFTLQNVGRAIYALLEGIEKVSAGIFGIRLDSRVAGPYEELFEGFNGMCRELESVQTLRDDFINHFSHEFKTPISSIKGFAEILLKESIGEEDRVKYLTIILSEAERLAEMSSNALTISKLDSLRVLSDRAPYSLDEQLRQCIIILSPQWKPKGLEVTAELERVIFTGNEGMLQHVWLNILGNAVKFTDSGFITVSLKKTADGALVRITDTGKGMSSEETDRIFDKYYQVNPSGSSKGLGLGLPIARRIVELSGGKISAESNPEQGSTFSVSLHF